eukprot:SAG22_NODE_6497_length_847_cov_0.695187_1_plen_191_part_01
MRHLMLLPLLVLGARSAAALTVRPPPVPRPWRQLPREAAEDTAAAGARAGPGGISFLVALTERNGPELRKVALAVSDPASPSYGRHLNAAQLDALTAPAPEHAAAVAAWLGGTSGCTALAGAPQKLLARVQRVHCSVEAAERLLQTSFVTLYHPASGGRVLRAAAYEIPAHLEGAIAAIFGFHGLPRERHA